jgi:hypothetical protein
MATIPEWLRRQAMFNANIDRLRDIIIEKPEFEGRVKREWNTTYTSTEDCTDRWNRTWKNKNNFGRHKQILDTTPNRSENGSRIHDKEFIQIVFRKYAEEKLTPVCRVFDHGKDRFVMCEIKGVKKFQYAVS